MIKRLVPFFAVLVLFCTACTHSSGNGGGGDGTSGTGADTSTPTATELAVITEMNFARTKPQDYVTQRLVPQRTNPTINLNGTSSFSVALEECIAQMNAMSPLGSLSAGNGLYKAAREWVQTQGAGSSTGHQSGWDNRVRKYVTATVVGENIAYGYSTPEAIVAALLIDDGVADRGHRKNILETGGYGPYTHAGVSIGSHGYYNIMCCINYAGGNYADK